MGGTTWRLCHQAGENIYFLFVRLTRFSAEKAATAVAAAAEPREGEDASKGDMAAAEGRRLKRRRRRL
jgi:hypothetical protein